MKTLFLYFLLCSVCLGEESVFLEEDPFAELFAEEQLEKKKWAKEIVASSEYGKERNYVFMWDKLPTVSIFNDGCSPWQKNFIKEKISILNHYLKLKGSFFAWKVIEDDNENADIKIKNLEKNKEFIGRHTNPDELNGYCHLWDKNGRLYRGEVFLRYKLRYEDFEHIICEEVMHTTGILNDSYRKKSIFFAGNESYSVSNDDFYLIKFFYDYFRPGMNEKTAFEIIDERF